MALAECGELLQTVVPHLGRVLVEQVSPENGLLRIVARAPEPVPVQCPDCGMSSRRWHSGHWQRLADGAVGGGRVFIELAVRRLLCDAPRCGRVTFAEQVDGLTVRYGRRTPQLRACCARSRWPWPAGPVNAWRAGCRRRSAGPPCSP
ncbi:transposase family protein [Streptomyces sp. NPDC057690]|uniref:transposase family protein n=1 Tax=Streptomyces sp. NPDC057690 TaxID=3346214 RepID=UPI0036B5E22D